MTIYVQNVTRPRHTFQIRWSISIEKIFGMKTGKNISLTRTDISNLDYCIYDTLNLYWQIQLTKFRCSMIKQADKGIPLTSQRSMIDFRVEFFS